MILNIISFSLSITGLAISLILFGFTIKLAKGNEALEKENIDLLCKNKELDFNINKLGNYLEKIENELQTNQYNNAINLQNKIKTILSSDQTN